MTKKLQVFVSSTYIDLKKERQAAVAAILKLGHIPAGMELFTAGDQSQWDTIRTWIDESDVYMLILGGRYGSVEEKSGLSYTELEYDYAVQTGKPFFSVAITDAALERKVQGEGIAAIETLNGGPLKSFRNKVLSSISSFFDDEKDIRLCVYESLADFSTNKNLVGWVPGNTVVDTMPLFDEIKKLSDEGVALRAKIAEYERRSNKVTEGDLEYENMRDLLEKTELDVPENISKHKDLRLSLLAILEQSVDSLSTGFDNSSGISDSHRFLYFDVAPQLKVHGLTQYEKIAGSQCRRCTFTTKGEKFMSEHIRRNLEMDTIENAPESITDSTNFKKPEPDENKAKKTLARAKKIASK
jgi:hypothetical protein